MSRSSVTGVRVVYTDRQPTLLSGVGLECSGSGTHERASNLELLVRTLTFWKRYRVRAYHVHVLKVATFRVRNAEE